MRKCVNCGGDNPIRFKDTDGKLYNLQRRKYCFKCSPFKKHNTSKIEVISKDEHGNRICKKCGRSFVSKRRLICNTCNTDKQRHIKKDFIISLVGNRCWNCGYGGEEKYIPILHMHHVCPEDKKFPLSSTEINMKSREEILEEAKKCVILCNRCHMEYHYTDLISDDDIKKMHEKWKEISIDLSKLKDI